MVEVAEKSKAGILTPLDCSPDFAVYNLDLHTSAPLANLRHYFDICKGSTDLLVTTSCFAAWKRGKFRNSAAKIIPAVPADGGGGGVRVFFFDDKISLHAGDSSGSADSVGICNLRDMRSGEFVDFSVGRNGFRRDSAYRHTIIHHSSEYRNVLIQANILDAMSNPDYFTNIINTYAQPGERLIVFMDVNGTILWEDSMIGLSPGGLLLNTLFGFMKLQPHAPCEFQWDADHRVRLDGPEVLSHIVSTLAGSDPAYFRDFWELEMCCDFLRKLKSHGEICWSLHPGSVDPEELGKMYEQYLSEILKESSNGITPSWLRCVSEMRSAGHAIVIQSFGTDTQRILPTSGAEARRIPHIAINFELWDESDAAKFLQQFLPSTQPKAGRPGALLPCCEGPCAALGKNLCGGGR